MKSMRRLTAAAILLLGMSVGAASPQASKKAKFNVANYVKDELLIKFKLGEHEKGASKLREIGASVLEKLSKIDISRLSLPKGMSVEKAVEHLTSFDFVEFAEPNYIHRIVGGGPNDPKYKKQWGLEKIRALKGWGIHTGRSKTVIAIVDTGVDLSHPDLKNKLVPGYNFIENDDKPADDEGHGTHCAGIAAASTNNKKGIAGVCPNCSIMPLRGLGADGKGTTTTVANAVIYAADHGADVISMSFGGTSYSTTLKNAVKYAARKGAVLVAAAGNDGVSDPFYPAYLDQCIAVGAVTRSNDERATFSNFGDWVDAAAPGTQILSTASGGGYAYKQGTSMAAPFVAGLAGLMVSCSGKSAKEVRKALLSSAVPVGDWAGAGRIDVPGALEAVGCTSQGGDDTPSSETKSPSNDKASRVAPGTVKSFEVQDGKLLSGTEEALRVSDDTRLVVKSRGAGISSILDLRMVVPLKTGATYAGLKVQVEGYAENTGAFGVYLRDVSSGEWVEVGVINLRMTEGTAAVEIADAGAYINKNGEVEVSLYRKEKRWKGFETGVDFVKVTGLKKVSAPKPDVPSEPEEEPAAPEEDSQGKTNGEKLKDLWDRLKKNL